MKTYTKYIKSHFNNDFSKVTRCNNNKREKMDARQIEKAIQDKKVHYKNKWVGLLEDCTTIAQKNYCTRMLSIIENHTR